MRYPSDDTSITHTQSRKQKLHRRVEIPPPAWVIFKENKKGLTKLTKIFGNAHRQALTQLAYLQWRTHGGGFGGQNPPPFGDGTGNEDLSFYFNDPLLLRTELAEIANMSLLFNSPV